MADIIRVRNNGDALRLAYNSQITIVGTGQDAFIEREAACIHFGNWVLRGKEREQEYKRIRGLYGAHLDRIKDPKEPSPDELWDRNYPKVELYETDGTKITPIWEDVEGTELPIEGSTVQDKERELQLLRERLEALEASFDEPEDQELPGVDSPENAPRRRAVKTVVKGAETG